MTAPTWADASYTPFGVADAPVPGVDFEPLFGEAAPAVVDEETPQLDDTGAPVIEWAPATREQIGDGDIIRVTQVGTWKGTRLTGKVTTYERRTPST